MLTSILLCLAVSVNAQKWWKNSKTIKGNGNVTTETRKTSDYDKIAVGGSFDVELVKGKEGNISLEGEDNLLPYIETVVEKNTLKVRYKKNINIKTTRRLTITIPFTAIEGISLGGSGSVSSNSVIKAEDFKANIGGSGNMKLEVNATSISSNIGGSGSISLSGKATELKCSIAGFGNIKAYDLNVDKAKVSIAGSGSVQTTAKSYIKASVAGSGNVYYKGNPEVKKSAVGSGSVINKN